MRFECDCEHCPLSWEERGYDDADAGCHWYDDFYGNKFVCFLPRFIKNILLKRNMWLMDKRYEGIGEWYVEQERKTNALQKAIKEILFEDCCNNDVKRFLCYEIDGKIYKYDTEQILFDNTWRIRERYEDLLKESEV